MANILVQALAWVAQEESDAISRRTVAGLARARAQGKRTNDSGKLNMGGVEAIKPESTEGHRWTA